MVHYVCTGSCDGESNDSGVCEAKFCSKEGRPLVPCECEDGLHAGAGQKTDSEDATD
ncbi:MAG: hypothetical protein HYV67_04290 [Candidatus Taylorbacteria bacterium]|nr:hypothetical protein [Candidatus Taylorbacteria bacterium]